jgi:DNA-directed RNA polymerase subunit K/omega
MASKYKDEIFDVEEDDEDDLSSIEEDDEEPSSTMIRATKIKSKKNKEDEDEDDEEEEEDEEDGDGIIEEGDVDDDDEEDDEDEGDEDEDIENTINKTRNILSTQFDDSDSDDNDIDADDNYLQKFDESIKEQLLLDYHPELKIQNSIEVEALSRIVRNDAGNIIDPLHKTIPFITRYEKARILGERAKQINNGAKAFVELDISVMDGYLIALKEYEEKKIPFIIKRPIPGGGCEYWKFADLEQL